MNEETPSQPRSRAGSRHTGLFEGFLPLCLFSLVNREVMPLPPFDSCLFCVTLTEEKALHEGGRTLKCQNV